MTPRGNVPFSVASQTAETHIGWTCRQCGVLTPKQDIFITPFFLFLLVAVVNTGQKQLGEGRVYLAKIHSPSLRESGQGLGDGAWGQNWATENSPHCLLPRSPWLVQPFSHNPEPPPVGSPTVSEGLPHQLLIRKIEYATHMPTGNLVKAFFSIEVLLPRWLLLVSNWQK